MSTVDLSRYDNSWYNPGRSFSVRAAWFFAGLPILRCRWLPSSAVRRGVLRLFGAKVARDVVIKPGVRVKFPWLLELGDNSWLGEDVWLDNLAPIRIGANVCISQGAYLCTGNHDWCDPRFGLRVQSIKVGNGAWIGAKAVLCPGVEVGEGAVAAAGCVVTCDLDAHMIYAGNPSAQVKARVLQYGGR